MGLDDERVIDMFVALNSKTDFYFPTVSALANGANVNSNNRVRAKRYFSPLNFPIFSATLAGEVRAPAI